MFGLPITSSELQSAVNKGSPTLLHAVGRAFGLGQAERTALTQGAFPAWFWIVVGLGAGVVVGTQVQKRWPNQVNKVFGSSGGRS
jgi:hypothetical protein